MLDLNRSRLEFSKMVEDDKGRREHNNKSLLLVLGHVMMILSGLDPPFPYFYIYTKSPSIFAQHNTELHVIESRVNIHSGIQYEIKILIIYRRINGLCRE